MQNSTDDYSHLKTRPQNFLKNAFIYEGDLKQTQQSFEKILFTSACDLGVALNGGRIGAKYGPTSILNSLGKFQTYKDSLKILTKPLIESTTPDQLSPMQAAQTKEITRTLLKNEWKKLIHLGGGHDHVYPLLHSLTKVLFQNEQNETTRLICLNIDAHLDTRTDKQVHSGTPFRQWMEEVAKMPQAQQQRVRFSQLAIHEQSNHPSNYKLKGMMVDHFISTTLAGFPKNELDKLAGMNLNKDDVLVLSLDCDVFDASEFPAVSAPNGRGLAIEKFRSLLNGILSLPCRKVFGIYEYNPIYDDLATSCARKLAFLIEDFIQN